MNHVELITGQKYRLGRGKYAMELQPYPITNERWYGFTYTDAKGFRSNRHIERTDAATLARLRLA